ncbi:MAG: Panacea domain-containing protein [Bdellovibrionota bacterium]
MSHPTYQIKFDVNPAKALEALIYVISKRPNGVNIYNALKSIFAADKDHLNRHGRPVTGDTYIRMEYGTVPSFVYNIINKDILTLMDLGIQDVPFKQNGYLLSPTRKPEPKHFSKSDLQSLDRGCEEYLDLDFSAVKEMNHREKCWLETGMNQPIAFELIIDDEKMLEQLRSMPFKQAI